MSDWREYVRVYQVRVLRLGCVGLKERCQSLSVSREEVVLHQVLGRHQIVWDQRDEVIVY